jgi:hypothetical protein
MRASIRCQLVAAVQAVDDGRRLAGHLEEDLAAGVGMRLRHRHAALGQVLHQPQVEGQLLGGEALEQRQHITLQMAVALAAVDEVVGVLDARADAAQRRELPEGEMVQQSLGLGGADFGENGHGSREHGPRPRDIRI